MLQKKEDGNTRKQDEAIQPSKSAENKGIEKSSEIQFKMTMNKEFISVKFLKYTSSCVFKPFEHFYYCSK